MDRSQIIGLVLMLVFITIYFQFFAPEPPKPEEAIQNQDTTSQMVQSSISPVNSQVNTLSDSAKAQLNDLKFGLFSPFAEGIEQLTTFENEQIKITFSNQGGMVKKVVLKEFKDFKDQDLVLVNGNKTNQNIILDHLSRRVNLSELYFSSQQSSRNDSTLVTYKIDLGEGRAITYEYTIPKEGYEIGFKVLTSGLNGIIGNSIIYEWDQDMKRLEMNLQDARNKTTVRYRLASGDVDDLSISAENNEQEELTEPVNWISFNQKFFSAAIILDQPAISASIATIATPNDSSLVKKANMTLVLPADKFMANQFGGSYYFGPNNYSILKKVAPDFEANVELGYSVLSWINKFAIIPIFHFLEKYIANYGIIIIIMVFLIRIVLAPLTYKSHLGMAKMRVMKPELDEIKEKHGGDMQKAQQEQMALYQKVGINPLSGCIPMLLQMPILFAMFYFFPNSIELRQKSFLWAHDLSTYDSILDLPFNIPFYGDHVSLFTLLMTASTILYTWSNSQVTTIQGPMKTLQYVMPVMFLFFLNSYSSGLTFYYFVSNIVSFGQIALFRKFIDEDKIKRALEENKKKNANKKKSSFQQRLEDAMKANEAAKKKSKK
ncbi:MAG: membrane protein insertase YidC [Bacteroidota bacterium]